MRHGDMELTIGRSVILSVIPRSFLLRLAEYMQILLSARYIHFVLT